MRLLSLKAEQSKRKLSKIKESAYESFGISERDAKDGVFVRAAAPAKGQQHSAGV
jgi:hypothetical protein